VHLGIAVAAAKAGHTCCEKPLATTADEARQMTEAAEAAGDARRSRGGFDKDEANLAVSSSGFGALARSEAPDRAKLSRVGAMADRLSIAVGLSRRSGRATGTGDGYGESHTQSH
jgi:hypothetical protein